MKQKNCSPSPCILTNRQYKLSGFLITYMYMYIILSFPIRNNVLSNRYLQKTRFVQQSISLHENVAFSLQKYLSIQVLYYQWQINKSEVVSYRPGLVPSVSRVETGRSMLFFRSTVLILPRAEAVPSTSTLLRVVFTMLLLTSWEVTRSLAKWLRRPCQKGWFTRPGQPILQI